MNKNLLLIGGGLLALMAIKPASAASRTFGNGTMPNAWARRNQFYNNAAQQAQQRQSTNQSISQALGLASLAKTLGLGNTFSTIGQSISGAIAGSIGAASDAALASTASDYAAADALTSDWLTSAGVDMGTSAVAADSAAADSVLAFDPTGGWLAGAAVVAASPQGEIINQQAVSSINGLGDSVANIFGW